MEKLLARIRDSLFYDTTSVLLSSSSFAVVDNDLILAEQQQHHSPHGFYYFSNATTTLQATAMRTLLASFLVLIFVTVACSAEGFRTFLGRSTRRILWRRRKRNPIVSAPLLDDDEDNIIYEEEQEEEHFIVQQQDEDSSSESSLSSPALALREASRVFFQELWEDFSPFNYNSTTTTSSSSEELDDNSNTNATAFDNETAFERDMEANVVHFCFLVHGHRGFSKDLSYLQSVMRHNVKIRKQEQPPDEPQQQRHDVVVHSATCNERKTDDGVEAGGERLAEEVVSVILNEMNLRRENATNADDELPMVTISFLGNSLGGLYSRFAIAKVLERCQRDTEGNLRLDGHAVHLNTFCTTATPHLGVASHTFIKIPRTAELGVARAMGQTGRDLFRVNPLMRAMATQGHFLNPMKLFRQRIAYANAYGTDFPVPVHTAAFLHEESDYPHHFAENKLQSAIVEEHSDLCVATIHTPAQHHHHTDDNFDVAEEEDELVVMSRSLDALGWKKVFVDPRKIVPKLSNPITRIGQASAKLGINLGNSTSSNSSSSDHDGEVEAYSEIEHNEVADESERSSSNNNQTQEVAIDLLKARGVAPSSEVSRAVSASPQANEQFHWPFGHNMIVAMSRNTIYTYLNKSGRPIVDALAAELVNDIFEFTTTATTDDEDPAYESQKIAAEPPSSRLSDFGIL